MKRTIVTMMLAMILLAGCGSTPGARYIRAEKSMTATMNSFTAIKSNLSESEVKTLDTIFEQGNTYLNQWSDALDANEPSLTFEQNYDFIAETIKKFIQMRKGQ